VVPFEDNQALAAAIRSILQDPAEAARLGANGRNFVLANFQWSSLVRNWLAQLSEVRPVSTQPSQLERAESPRGVASFPND